MWAVPVQTLEDFTADAVVLMAAYPDIAQAAMEALESETERLRLEAAIAKERKGKARAQAMQPVQAPFQVELQELLAACPAAPQAGLLCRKIQGIHAALPCSPHVARAQGAAELHGPLGVSPCRSTGPKMLLGCVLIDL